MKVKYTKLNDEAIEPLRAHEFDAGVDMYATTKEVDHDNKKLSYGTGIAIQIPKGYVGLLCPRSSIYKKDQRLSNCVGVIDSQYIGEIKFNFDMLSPCLHFYDVGERIGQLVIVPVLYYQLQFVDKLEDSDRGVGGFGSSGDK